MWETYIYLCVYMWESCHTFECVMSRITGILGSSIAMAGVLVYSLVQQAYDKKK